MCFANKSYFPIFFAHGVRGPEWWWESYGSKSQEAKASVATYWRPSFISFCPTPTSHFIILDTLEFTYSTIRKSFKIPVFLFPFLLRPTCYPLSCFVIFLGVILSLLSLSFPAVFVSLLLSFSPTSNCS